MVWVYIVPASGGGWARGSDGLKVGGGFFLRTKWQKGKIAKRQTGFGLMAYGLRPKLAKC